MTQSNPAMLSDRLSDREAEKREFKWALRIGFTAFLVIALVSRLLPRSWRPQPLLGGQGGSVIAEARKAAHTIVPLAFMR